MEQGDKGRDRTRGQGGGKEGMRGPEGEDEEDMDRMRG